ncbi:MAG TPA: alpha/beta hydrolase [Gammaproteobacteria bacterium]|nr:alpha/beta hydrolase [Gammaproteobacteria bacterium]
MIIAMKHLHPADTDRASSSGHSGRKSPASLSLTVHLLIVLLLAGCATTNQGYIDRLTRTSGFERLLVQGGEFEHVVWLHRPAQATRRLHIYLEGDGSPWIGHLWIASDPTPAKPLMLKLMKMDNTPSVYLGRPCYFGMAGQPSCNSRYWTYARYSESVVDSMQQALDRVIRQTDTAELIFMGHSGGGTLAMLLAERFPQTRAVVTLAGNLDTDRWTRWHGYLPLRESLNPAARTPLSADIYQLHLAGARDQVVPPALIEPVVARQPGAHLQIIPGFDHTCCWGEIWPDILQTLNRQADTPRPET